MGGENITYKNITYINITTKNITYKNIANKIITTKKITKKYMIISPSNCLTSADDNYNESNIIWLYFSAKFIFNTNYDNKVTNLFKVYMYFDIYLLSLSSKDCDVLKLCLRSYKLESCKFIFV